MLQKLFYLSCSFLLFHLALVACLDAVFDLPGQFTYKRRHSVLVTTFHENESESLTIAVNVRHENESSEWTPIRAESSILGSSLVNTRRLFLTVNSTPARMTYNRNNDVMFYVIVEVSVRLSNENSWIQEKRIPVVKIKGHVFIQTDRSIYKPGDEVFIRFLPVDAAMMPLDQPMDMSVLAPNPKPGGSPLVSWTKKKSAVNQVLVRSFVLPDTPPIGRWTVAAKFYKNDVVNDEFLSSFYVEDLTLPTFDLTLQPITEGFIVSHDQVLLFEIEAKFIYGENVDGSASIKVGLFNELWRNNPLVITLVMSNQNVVRGKCRFSVHVTNVTSGYNFSSLLESGARLFVEVFVSENSGIHTRSVRNTDVIFTSAPLKINIDEIPAYFKPGLTFIAPVEVYYLNGSAASDVRISTAATGRHEDGRTERIYNGVISTDSEGWAPFRFTASTNIIYMRISTRATYRYNGRNFSTETAIRIYPQSSDHNQYMQIFPLQRKFSVGTRAEIEIHFTTSPLAKTIIYSIASVRGYSTEGMVEAASGAHWVSISFLVVGDMSPISHVTAYYVTHTSEGLPFIVADSSSITVDDTCPGRGLDLTLPAGSIFPGDALDIEVFGEPSSYVGLIGVNAAIGLIEKDFAPVDFVNSATVSRKKLFNILRSNAQRCGKTTTPFTESAFPSVGRILLSSVSHNADASSRVRCYNNQRLRKNKRSITTPWMSDSVLLGSANDFFENYYTCCAVGASNVSEVMTYDENTCEKRAESVTLNLECKHRFLECCLDAERKATQTEKLRARTRDPRQRSLVAVVQTVTPFYPGTSVMDRAVQLTRTNFDWTWFNSDFRLGSAGHKHLHNESNPKLPRLPDSITSWTIRGFSMSQDHGLCVMNPLTFTVEHSLFIKVDLPPGEVVRGKMVPVEVTVHNYLPHQIEANVSLHSNNKSLCTSTENRLRIRTIRGSDNGAVIDVIRFNVIPLEVGSYNIKVQMEAFYNNISQPRVDTVVKTLVVVPEGTSKQHVEWMLVDTRSDRRGSPSLTPMIHIPLPNNSVPGSETAVLRIHSFASAFLQEPKCSLDERGTISPYLYQLQFIISKLEISRNELSATEIQKLTTRANIAYTGLLRFLRDVRDPVLGESDPLYGFSFSPAVTSKPDLWLTCATLRTICLASELADIEPDQSMIAGTLRWILQHQNHDRNSYFARSPVKNTKTTGEIKAAAVKKSSGLHRRYTQVLKTDFSSKIETKLYRTSVVASFLHQVLKSTNKRTKASWRRHPGAFDSINSYDLRDSLRRALRYVKTNIMKTYRTSISPVVVTASARAIMKISGKVDRRLEETLNNLKQENSKDDLWWIGIQLSSNTKNTSSAVESRKYKTERDETTENDREPSKMRRMKAKSSSIEATAYMLDLLSLKGQSGEKYANWLLKKRKRNNRWVSLVSTIAAAEGIQTFVLQSGTFCEENNLRINVGSAEMSVSPALIPRSPRRNEIKVPITSNVMNVSASGVGRAWMEVDVTYTIPQEDLIEQNLCPFEVTVSVYPVRATTVLALRSLTSSVLLQVDLDIRFQSWYDPLESGDPSYVVDFGLNSNYEPVLKDLEMLSNPIEKIIDHYLVTDRGLMLYFSTERKISFKITEKRRNLTPLPYAVYPASHPERRCQSFYTLPGVRPEVSTLCSNNEERRQTGKSLCYCVTSGSCPKIVSRSKSVQATTQSRIKLTCKPATMFAYRIRFEKTEFVGKDWIIYSGQIRHAYKSVADLRDLEHNSTFWVRRTCDVQRIFLNKDYFLVGRSIVQGENGVFKHLLDSFARFEQWPGRNNNCERFAGQTQILCRKMNDYGYNMRINGCTN